MRQAQRQHLLSSPRQWLMLGSVATLLVLVVVYVRASFSNVSWDWNTSGDWRGSVVRQAATVRSSSSHSIESPSSLRAHSSRSVTKEMMKAVVDALDDDDEENKENTDKRSDKAQPKDKDNPPSNPSFYGWTPDAYPNPLIDPVRCAISNFVDPRHVLDPYNTNITNSRSGRNDGRYFTDSHSNSQPQQPSPLYLCDPDGILGNVVLEDLAGRLVNFSAPYSLSSTTTTATMAPLTATSTMTHYARSRPHYAHSHDALPTRSVHVAVATVRKMNLAAVLRGGSYFSYEDENDMVNDAAQIFARSLFDAWFISSNGIVGSTNERNNDHFGRSHSDHDDRAVDDDDATANTVASSYVLVFLSIQDRVCFITTGMELSSVLPWWRLDHVVASMKPELSRSDYGPAIVTGMDLLDALLKAGPPTMRDRFHDFMARFGVVIAFAAFTFVFGAWGEYRDRRKRWQYAEQRSKLNGMDRDKARQLQKEYHTRVCPICLEWFDYGEMHPQKDGQDYYDYSQPQLDDDKLCDKDAEGVDACFQSPAADKPSTGMKRVDTFGIPLKGVDGKKIKLLRCGHVFCETCWTQWVHSGCGNPCNCPVCRQDVGKAPRKRKSRDDGAATNEGDDHNPQERTSSMTDVLPPQRTYGAVSQTRPSLRSLVAFSPSPTVLFQTLRGHQVQGAINEAIASSGRPTAAVQAASEDGCSSRL